MKIKCKIAKAFGALVLMISTFIAITPGQAVSIPLYGVPEPESQKSVADILIQIGSMVTIPIVLIIGIIVFIKKMKNKD